jgi:hypothetical protein
MPLISRVIFYFVSVYLAVGAHVADWGPSHLLNPRWPPHAKFHDGQTLMFSIFLAILTIYFASSRSLDKKQTLVSTVSFASLYWVTQALAIVYPGTAFVDPEFDKPSAYIFGLHAQVFIVIIALSLITFATVYAARRFFAMGHLNRLTTPADHPKGKRMQRKQLISLKR